jgi:hypothetical protein
MYKVFLAMTLFISALGFSQDSINHTTQQDTSMGMNSYYDSLQKEDKKRMNERSVNYFAQLSKERAAQQRKQAILYIAMGLFFLIVLVIGLRRRVKKTK